VGGENLDRANPKEGFEGSNRIKKKLIKK